MDTNRKDRLLAGLSFSFCTIICACLFISPLLHNYFYILSNNKFISYLIFLIILYLSTYFGSTYYKYDYKRCELKNAAIITTFGIVGLLGFFIVSILPNLKFKMDNLSYSYPYINAGLIGIIMGIPIFLWIFLSRPGLYGCEKRIYK
jgi:hypothetical protein